MVDLSEAQPIQIEDKSSGLHMDARLQVEVENEKFEYTYYMHISVFLFHYLLHGRGGVNT